MNPRSRELGRHGVGDSEKLHVGSRKEKTPTVVSIDYILDLVKSRYDSGETNWNRLPKDVRDFMTPPPPEPKRSFRGSLSASSQKQFDNILHELARKAGDFKEAHASFTKWLVTKSQYNQLLLSSAADYPNTPFHRALRVSNNAFVGIVLEDCPKKTLAIILKPENKDLNSQNCLHLAIEKRCPYTQQIIERCKIDAPDVFWQGDDEATKNTPLHLAVMEPVEPDETWKQAEIVRSLIDADQEALVRANAAGDTPYQARIGKLREAAAQESLALRVAMLDHYNVDEDGGGTPDGDGGDAGNHATVDGDSVRGENSNEQDGGSIHVSDDDQEAMSTDSNESNSNDGDHDDGHSSNDPGQQDENEDDEFSDNEADDDFHEEEDLSFRHIVIKDHILRDIRSYCIRQYKHRPGITQALYHGKQERETYFNLSGRANMTVTTTYLEKLARHLKFESVLSYVALPMLSVVDPMDAHAQGDSDLESIGKGRRDMGKIFEWLRKENVETIHEVTVIDSTEPSHSDAAIENALRGFNVETWDWKKLDLNCDVIANCTNKGATDVSLYCSGNYAVLMGWASTDGLRSIEKFPKLKHVHLYYQEGLEDSAKLEQYIDMFVGKLRDHKNEDGDPIEVTTTRDDKDNSYMNGFRVRDNARSVSKRGNRWLDSMSQFLQIVFNIPRKEAGYVKIAVIDNGVDASLDALDGKIAVGTSFCLIPDTAYHNPYYMTSETISHGSMVAGLICSMCPTAKLYVARIEELSSSGGQRRLTADSAAKAIRWAVKKKVDVICMSWTIERNQGQNDSAIDELSNAIIEAERDKIIMLCSASDQGSDSKGSLPGSTQKCIRIGASTEHGDKCSWVHKDDFDFCFPGENVPLETNKDGVVKMFNGSSVATAIAAGAVGLLLYLNRLDMKRRIGVVGDKEGAINDLKGHSAMVKALTSMCTTTKTTNDKCPRFGATFGEGKFNEFMFLLQRDKFFEKLNQIMSAMKK
ncbi:hypothetical protein QBC34DRAFT_26249 [Podospora aff. communis PSN243]|uniref:Peptidase S8/S53 domain-containing protein n=1 Tax=Podospora aff. communis PSN243 TaxID=3040156 RepID=A0AAV9GXS2_9PEZI|nr:hypothetical protein QBC34DRAFT_26249 [Podospora aff. communis PSN243]